MVYTNNEKVDMLLIYGNDMASQVNLFKSFIDNYYSIKKYFSGNYTIGLFTYHDNLNDANYFRMLQKQIIPAHRLAVEDINQVWFYHNGSPAHNSGIVTEYLRRIFNNKIIGNSGNVIWPAKFSDLIPVDYLL